MKAYEMSEIRPIEASRPGALNGFESKCSCGTVVRNTMLSATELDVAAHVAYHERKAK